MTCLRREKPSAMDALSMLRVLIIFAKLSEACFSDDSNKSTSLFFTR